MQFLDNQSGLLAAIFLPLILGYAILLLLFRKNSLGLLTSLALAFGLGFGLLAQWMFFLAVLKIELNMINISLPPMITALFLFYLAIRKNPNHIELKMQPACFKFNFRHVDFIAILLVVYVTCGLIYIFWRALNIPIYAWDEIATIVFKSKFFFFERSFEQFRFLPHATYPLQVELSMTWVALNLGYWSDQFIKIIFPITFLCYLRIHYSFLRNFTNERFALSGVALLISSNMLTHHATTAYRDITLLYYNCSIVILILLWNIKNEDGFLILASLFAGFGSFTKLDGTGYILIYSILLGIILRSKKDLPFIEKFKKFLKFFVPGVSICLSYHLYKHFVLIPDNQIHYDFDLNQILFKLDKESFLHVIVVIKSIFNNLLLTGNWNITWFILFLSLLNLKKSNLMLEVKILLVSLLLFFGIYLAGYSFTQYYFWIVEGDTVLSRGHIQLFPIATLLIILINFASEKHLPNKRSSL